MPNYKLTLSYDGTNYHGWQMQNNAITVQGTVQNALEKLYNEKIILNGCSRTDAGVHANMFCANYKCERDINTQNIICALNSFIPDDIAVLNCEKTGDDFHARFDCRGKEYIYIINNGKIKNVFMNKKALHYKIHLDEYIMNKAAAHFIGEHDFKAFCAVGSSVTSTVRTIYDCTVERQNDNVIVKVSGNGFLYNMVRIIVGTLIYVSDGKIKADDIPDIINSGDRNRAGVTVKPDGLYLNNVFYGGEDKYG